MSSCTVIDSGDFPSCDDVIVADIVGSVVISCIETSFTCSFEDGNFGKLNPGDYIYDYDSNNYRFTVTL